MRRSRFFITLIIGFQLVPSLVLAQGDGISHPVSPEPIASQGPRPSESPRPTPQVQVRPSPSPRPSGSPIPGQFCVNLTSVTGKIGSNTNDQFQQLKNNFSGRSGKVQSDMATVGQSLASARAVADQKRAADFAQLSGKATTDDQKQAVATFETSVTAAITEQRAVVDAADSAFEKGVLADITARQTDLATAAAIYKAAVQAALTAAQASCSAGDNPVTVRATLQTSLQTARTNLQNASNGSGKLGPNLTNLETARKTAVQLAESTAKTQIAQALTILKAALGLPAASPSPSVQPLPVD
ncbi:MAG TPA: hypothetical protein VMS08_01885 [Candidatus Saccharimonadia bacterium]|nr:hypothetical protein [Candidatus Saccharimonadia bacterium]